MNTSYISIVMYLFLLFGFRGVNAQESITYENAIKISLDNNLRIKQTQNGIRVNKALKIASKLNFLPQISANINGAETKGFQFSPQEQSLVDQEIQTLRANIRADLVVFNGFSKIYDLNRNKKLFLAKEKEVNQLKQDVVFETTQKFLQCLLDQEILNISRENEKTNKLLFSQVSAFVKEGRRAGLDSISQLAIYERSKLSITNALNKLSIDKLDLLRTMAFDPKGEVDFVVPQWDVKLLNSISYNSDELVQKGYKIRSDLQRLYLEKEAQKQQERFFKSRRLPRASIFYRYGSEYISNRTRRNQETNLIEDVPFKTQLFEENLVSQYGFNVTIPLFSNFSNRGNITRAKVEFENKDYEIDDLERKIALDIRNSTNNFYQLKQAYEVAKKASKAAELSFEKQKEMYDLGIGDLVTLNLEAQRNFRVKSEELQAKYTLLFQQKIIDYQVGILLEKQQL